MESTRTLWQLLPEELRRLADECDARSGNYIELLDQDVDSGTVTAKLDDEAGGEKFTIQTDWS